MALIAIKTEPGELKNLRQICRLCLSEESLSDVFEEQDLRQWISDFLSITISTEDQMSQAICDICRIRLNEFNQFRVHCQEVQVVLQSMMQDQNFEMEKEVFKLKSSYGTKQHEGEKHDRFPSKDAGYEELNGLDLIEIEAVKIESHIDNYMDSSSLLLDKSSSTLGCVHVQDSDQLLAKNVQGDEGIEKQQPFECNVCHKLLPNRQARYDHKRNVHGPKTHICHLCEFSFPNARKLKNHELTKQHLKRMRLFSAKQTAEEVRRDSEQNCSENNPVSDDLIHQATIDTNDGEYSCSKCNEAFNRKCLLENHMITHDAKSDEDQSNDMKEDFRTGEIDSDYSNTASTADKLDRAKDGADTNQNLQCDFCPKSFPTRKRLYNHRRRHVAKKLACHICGKPYLIRRDLQNHITTHDPKSERKERPFKCDICGRTFTLKSTLDDHLRKAHGPRIFKCQICGDKFRTRQILTRHEQRHEKDRKEQQKERSTIKDESLDDAEIKTSTASLQKEQNRIVSKPQCATCGKVFLNHSSLWRHSRFPHKKKLK